MDKLYANLKISKPKNSEIEIEGEIPVEVMEISAKKVHDNLRENFEAPGFRKGRVPEEIFSKHVNEMHVLEDAAEDALNKAYPAIISDNNIQAIGVPLISVTKIAPKNPLGFKLRVGVTPEVSLPNYKKIAKNIMDEKSEEIVVLDSEIQDVIKQFQQIYASGPDAAQAEKPSELTDEFVKKLGKFESVEDFKNKLKENIKKEKGADLKRKKREKLAEELVANSKITLPEIVLSQETHAAKERLLEDAKRAGITLADYLKQLNKTEEELLAEQKGYIERQMKTRFILQKIAEEEKIEVSEEDVAKEAALLKTHYKNADLENLKEYARLVIRNEKVMQFLEGSSDPQA